jgi:D-lactate dehydrogenase
MNVVFYDLQTWEKPFLFDSFLRDHEVQTTHEPLGPENASLAAKADAISVFLPSKVTRERLSAMPALRLVATRSTGWDHVDVAACAERGIPVVNVPSYGVNTVAEHTFGLLLTLSRNIHRAVTRTARGNFVLDNLTGFDLEGKTLGVVGVGMIGTRVAELGRAFGMRVLGTDPREDPALAARTGFTYVPLERLLGESDIVTLHAPALPATRHLMNKDTFRAMKRGALLINTARGELVDTAALADALDRGLLGGAGLDVLEGEAELREESELLTAEYSRETLRVLLMNHILLKRENVVLTPHMAFDSREAKERIAKTNLANLLAFSRGAIENPVRS